ncbi:MAG: HepT-like ribonuclease domain-containing protein [Gemmatimonadota bacterium]
MKDDTLYLIHVLERIRRIEEFTRGGKQAFLESLQQQDAVIRNFEVIGEAVNGSPPDSSWSVRRCPGGGSPASATC